MANDDEKRERPKKHINGFELNETFEAKGRFLARCFRKATKMREPGPIPVEIPSDISPEELTYIQGRLRAVHWAVAIEGNSLIMSDAPREKLKATA